MGTIFRQQQWTKLSLVSFSFFRIQNTRCSCMCLLSFFYDPILILKETVLIQVVFIGRRFSFDYLNILLWSVILTFTGNFNSLHSAVFLQITNTKEISLLEQPLANRLMVNAKAILKILSLNFVCLNYQLDQNNFHNIPSKYSPCTKHLLES